MALKDVKNTALSITIFLIALESASQVAFLILESKDLVLTPTLTDSQKIWLRKQLDSSTFETRFQQELGWRNQLDSDRTFADTSHQGLRGKKIYSVDKGGHLRIAALGDSFTFGDQVHSNETWPSVLEELNPGIEVLNFGVNGYGVDQSYWRYNLEVRRFDPDIVILGVLVSTAYRQANVFRPYCHPEGSELLTKPRYKLVDGELVYIENPFKSYEEFETLLTDERNTLRRLGQNDYCFHRKGLTVPRRFPATLRWPSLLTQRISEGEDVDKLTASLIKKFYLELKEEGRSPLVVLLNSMRSLKHPEKYHLATKLDELNVPYLDTSIDLRSAYQPKDIEKLYVDNGHHNFEGNALMARIIDRKLGGKEFQSSNMIPSNRSEAAHSLQ